MAEIPIQRKEGRNIWPMLIGLLLLLAILWYVFSRRNNANTAAARTDSTAVASNGGVTTDSSAGSTANNMANGAAAGAAGAAGAAMGAAGAGMNGAGTGSTGASGSSGAALNDAGILAALHAANQGEVTAGRMAETKASNADVKSFAREMVKDHGSMDAKGTKLASTVGGSSSSASGSSGASGASGNAIADSVTSANQAAASQLQSAGSGTAFDRAYMDAQVQGHQNTLAFLQQAQNAAQNADLKKMITQAIPDVQKHLERARSLQSKVGQ